MENRIKVRCMKPNKYGFIVGDIYDGYIIKSAIKNKNEIISVINEFGEEYAYPAELFAIESVFGKEMEEILFDKKYFRIRWMNFGELCRMEKEEAEKIWVFDFDRNVGFYKIFTNGEETDMEIISIDASVKEKLISLLDEGFIKEKDCWNCYDGDGWEMILYNENGEAVHRFRGYTDGNGYLNQIIDLVTGIVR